jgi:hypothetical protein
MMRVEVKDTVEAEIAGAATSGFMRQVAVFPHGIVPFLVPQKKVCHPFVHCTGKWIPDALLRITRPTRYEDDVASCSSTLYPI